MLAFESKSQVRLGKINGTVTDNASKEGLIGVSIKVKGINKFYQTNASGEYEIEVEAGSYDIVFNYLGYQTKTVPIILIKADEKKVLNVGLNISKNQLGEVVVVGYGTQQKRDLTGSVASIEADQLEKRYTNNTLAALSGLAPGVTILNNTGSPEGDYKVIIRGLGSITASNDPLYVIDGVIDADPQLINPTDIASINVLKDASATSIYGTRGSNGVIIITTKQGGSKSEGSMLSFNATNGVMQLARKLPLLNAAQYVELENIFKQNRNTPIPDYGTLEPLLYDANGKPRYDTDWQDESFRNAITQNYNLNLSGRLSKNRYLVNLGYQNDEGILMNTGAKNYRARLNYDSEIKSWLTSSINFSFTQQNLNLGTQALRAMSEIIPIIPVQYPDGFLSRNSDHAFSPNGQDHPVNILNNRIDQRQQSYGLGNAIFNIKLSPNLDFKTSIGAQGRFQRNDAYIGKTLTAGIRDNGRATINSRRSFNWQSSNYLTYKKTFSKKHSFEGLLGAEWLGAQVDAYAVDARGFSDDFYGTNNLGVATQSLIPTSDKFGYNTNSYFSRFNYNFKQKYYLTATARVDGSSRFGENNKYALFPSTAVAWVLSEESFLKSQKWINFLKLRASIGQTGNSEFRNYQYLSSLGALTDAPRAGVNFPVSAIFNGQRFSGVVPINVPNNNLQWEKATQTDIGLDMNLFNDKIKLTADWYNKKTDKLLYQAPLPNHSGFSNVTANIGSIQNSGYELGLNTLNINKKFQWTTTFNVAFNRNKVLALGVNNEDVLIGGNTNQQNTNILRVNQPLGAFYGYVRLGIWGTAETDLAKTFGRQPGDPKLLDRNGDGTITPDDRTIIGNGYPKAEGSFINNFSYKGWGVFVDLQFVNGNDIYNLTKYTTEERVGTNVYTYALDAWTPENQSSTRRKIGSTAPTGLFDTYYVEDGSFIRGRNISLSYTFPKSIISKMKLQSLKLSAGVQNVFLVTKYTGYDPEAGTFSNPFTQGVEFYQYPKNRLFNFGLNITL